MRPLLLILLCCAIAFPALARASDDFASGWTGIEEAEVRLIAGRTGAGEDMLGLHFAMAPHWKIYWRSPGDAGFPPVPDWSGTEGVSGQHIEWPLPKRFVFYGLETHGYENEAVLPIRLQRSGAARVRLHLLYAACADICVPVETTLSLDLPEGAWPENRHGRAIAAAMNAVPRRIAEPRDASASMREGNLRITVTPSVPVSRPEAILEPPEGFVLSRPRCLPDAERISCTARVIDAPGQRELGGEAVTITVYGDGPAQELQVVVDNPAR